MQEAGYSPTCIGGCVGRIDACTRVYDLHGHGLGRAHAGQAAVVCHAVAVQERAATAGHLETLAAAQDTTTAAT